MNYESFSFSVQEYGAELTSQSHQTLYWLNRNGYLDNEKTLHLLKHMVVVPVKNQKKFGRYLLERFFGRDASDDAYVFPITMLEERETHLEDNNSNDNNKPTLKVVK